MRQSLLAALAALVVGAAGVQAMRARAESPGSLLVPPAAARQASAVASTAAEHQALLQRYCLGCHNERLRTASLVLDPGMLTEVPRHAETLEKVLGKLRARTMPPQGLPRPDEVGYERLVAWLEGEIDRAAASNPNPGRRPAVHRLNRAEYTNAIRDLLALEIDGASLLPPDDSGYGFDNIADVLTVSPLLTERYLSAALKISRLAVGNPNIRPATETFAVNKYLRQEGRVSDDLPFGSRGGLAVRVYFPVDAEYVVKIFFDRTYDGRLRGIFEPQDLEVRLDGALVRRITIGGPEVGRSRNQPFDGTEVRFAATAGPKTLGVSFVRKGGLPEGMLRPRYSVTSYEYAGDVNVPTAIGTVELRGPYNVSGPGDSPSRRRIFVCEPTGEVAADEACARRILRRLARRAYRRPVGPEDIEPLFAFYRSARAAGGFDGGIEAALRRLLVSPDFLFRIEHDRQDVAPGTPYRVGAIALASRLSFFLWSSIPDDELLSLAERGELDEPAVLERQVRRMLADPRAQALVGNFAGQWLYLRNLRMVQPDPYLFPDFDENLRRAFEEEITLFLESQLREDQSVRALLTSDSTFVNERLARHYGIPNVYGSHFRRVRLEDEARWGLLGKGGILTVTSYPHRTSPVLRGKWLLENLLGAPPPPPPPDVPALQEAPQGARTLPMRERMEAHRANPACASCHKIMDPLGFALENFDAIGRWRGEDAGAAIDASSVLADGTPVDGPVALRAALDSRPEEFVSTVVSKLLTYALGRGVEYYDAPAVRRIVRDAAAADYRWSAIVVGIAKSIPFRMRTSQSPTASNNAAE
jgi:mono/diheme cytochrome c family protein